MTTAISFGAKLRSTRERRGLTQEEAAKALCLNVEIINALENEQFDKLPSPVFVRGYIKNYASLLRLVINEPPATPQAVSENAGAATETALKTENIKWFSSLNQIFFKLINYIVIISLIILVFFWWYERRGAVEKTEGARSVINMSVEKIPFERPQVLKTKAVLPIPKNNKKIQLSKDIMKSVFPGWPL